MVLGEQGIFKKAQEGANLMYDAEVNTQAGFNSIADEIDKITSGQGGGGTTPEDKSEIEQAKDSGEVFDTKTPIKDEHGNIIQIPGGFKVAEDSGDTVQQGIVIEDVNASGDEAVQGSQFVWIPVGTFVKDDKSPSNEIILGRYTFSEANGEPTLVQAAYTEDEPENYLKHGDTEIIEEDDAEYTELSEYRVGKATDGLDGENATAKDLAGFVNSAKTNGGYYIARYEASFASGDSIENYKAASKVSDGFSEDSMSYTEGTLWNFISQPDASKVAINTYSGSGVESDLMNSYAWDTAVVYIQEAIGRDYANQRGNSINNKLTNTGTKQDEICKINDMASNIWEWSTEYSAFTGTNYASPCTSRGGDFYYSDSYTAGRGCATATSKMELRRF